LRIYIWEKIAPLSAPVGLFDLSPELYQNIMERVPDERLELNLSTLPETAMRNIESMAIPELWAESLTDGIFNNFMTSTDYAMGERTFEAFFNPELLTTVGIDGTLYYLIHKDTLPILTGFEEIDEMEIAEGDINRFFDDIEVEQLGFDVDENDDNFSPVFWRDGYEEYRGMEILENNLDNGNGAEVMAAYKEYIQEVKEHNAMVAAQPEPPQDAAYGVDAGDEEDPMELQKFTDWYNENYDDELMDDIVKYDEERDEFYMASYRIQVWAIKKDQLPARGDDLEFLRYWVERKLGEEPPAVAALPAAAQAAFNAASLLPQGNF
jgi:hypothetical protein